MSKCGVTYDLKSPSKNVCVGCSVRSNAEVSSAEGICYVGFAGYSVEYLVELASVVPCPVGADQVVEWLMFACPFEDSMFGGFVVAQLYVRCGEHWFEYASFSLTTKRLYDVSSTCVLSHAMQLLLHQLQNVLWPKPTKRELPKVHFSICTSYPSKVTS